MSDNGIFGFLRAENFVTAFFLYGLMSGFMGSAGYIIATQYFNSVVVMNSFLTEPFIS